jgi:hypothetical protein
MLEPLFDDRFSCISDFLSFASSPYLTRRRFLGVAAMAGAGIALCQSKVFAEPAEANLWRDRVSGFINSVCSEDRADFHYSFSAPLLFVRGITPEEVVCGHYFQIAGLPLYDLQYQCQNIKDLNAWEIRRITNLKEIDRYGCVVAPCSRRRPPSEEDKADFIRTAESYELHPDTIKHDYTRMVNNGKPFKAFGVSQRLPQNPGARVNEKPARDVLLTPQDI